MDDLSTLRCPKCSRPVIELRDWGDLGVLYVHGYVEGLVDDMVPQACHIPLGVHRGDISLEDWRQRRLDQGAT